MNTVSGASNTCEGHCPRCNQNLNADIVASESRKKQWDEDEYGKMEEIDTYRILQCRGCETLYVQHRYWFSESQDPPHATHWPPPPAPDWVHQLDDVTLQDLLREVYGALNASHRVLAAIGARTALDRAMVLNGAEEASGFGTKIGQLREVGVISEHENQMLSKLTDAGNAAAHRGWKPQPEELTTLIDGMEDFLRRTLVLKSAVNAINVPPRVLRPKKSQGSSEN